MRIARTRTCLELCVSMAFLSLFNACSALTDSLITSGLAPTRDHSIKVTPLINKSFSATDEVQVFSTFDELNQSVIELANLSIDSVTRTKTLAFDIGGSQGGDEVSPEEALYVVKTKLSEKARHIGANALILKTWSGYHHTVSTPGGASVPFPGGVSGGVTTSYIRVYRVVVEATAVRFNPPPEPSLSPPDSR